MSKIYFLRHGLDDEKYIGGWSDVGLIEEGIKQVEKARKFLVKENISINKIYHSGIKRAEESALIINEMFNVDVEVLPELKELNKGDLNGMDKQLASRIYPQFENLNDINLAYPNGESHVMFNERFKDFLKTLNQYNNELFVTHRGIINMIYYELNKIPIDLDKKRFDATHGSIHELDLNQMQIRRIF